MSRIFHSASRLRLDELELSRTLELAAAALGHLNEPIMQQSPGSSRVIPHRQRLAAVAVLGEREPQLSSIQRLAWLMPPCGGCRNPTAASSSRMLCSLRVVRKRSRQNKPTSP